MAEQTNVLELTAAKLTGAGTARAGIFACRFLGLAYGDPSTPFVAGTNEWYELTEDNPVGSDYSYFYEDLPKGKYRLQVKDDSGASPVYTTIGHKANIHHSTLDLDNHINDGDVDMRHETTAIAIPAAKALRLGNDSDAAFDNIAGATWDATADDSLKDHLDHGTAPASLAHTDDAIETDTGIGGTVADLLDDHESRITALETGTASTPTGIEDFIGDLGIDIVWTAQDVDGIEYAVKYLWKHTSETVPGDEGDLSHYRRCLAPETEVTFRSRRFDLSSSPDSDLVLYYAIGAKGRADSDFTWSSVESINVTLPEFTQVFSGVLSGMSACCPSGGSSVYALDSGIITSVENFPAGSESGGAPIDDYIKATWQAHNITITAIELESGSAMSGDATISYRSQTTGTGGTFTVASSNRRGYASGLSLALDAGDELQLWTADPKGIGHWRITVWFTRS